jgi:osmotically-inducible protein OsmY
MKNPIAAPLRTTLVLGAIAASVTLSACAPLLVGGAAVGSAFMVTDRRTSGTQIDDQSIELKAGNRVGQLLGDRGHVNVTSYNRAVLLTGEVPTDADKTAVEQAVQRVENVKSTVNELLVTMNSSLASRSNDTILTSKVKATYIDAKDLQANAIKVVTEYGTVYLMGRVTEREASRAASLAAGINGVKKVVRVFEVISEDELAGIRPATPAPASASAPESAK